MNQNKLYIWFCILLVPLTVFSASSKRIKLSKERLKRRQVLEKFVIERVRKDYIYFTSQELDKIEKLYQVANTDSHSVLAKESLEKLISMRYYKSVNRMGCAYLYLGTMMVIEDWKKIDYLKTAIEEYNDCWYGDSVQVGPYARYWLAKIYYNQNEKDKAKELFDDILKNYPDAIDHSANLLSDKIKKYFIFE